jgi:hypothetical protein
VHGLRVHGNRVLRRIIGNKRETGENYTPGRFIIYIIHQILLGRLNYGELNWQGM